MNYPIARASITHGYVAVHGGVRSSWFLVNGSTKNGKPVWRWHESW